jgi:Trehalose-6-phosphate synthase
MERSQRRLVVVSNRLPFQLLEKGGKVTLKESDGGLVSALKSYFESEEANRRATFASHWWIGSAEFPEKRWEKFLAQGKTKTSFAIDPIFIEKRTYNLFYNGFCNATLWPLFHYFPSYVEYDEEAFRAYEEVNRAFADRLFAFLTAGRCTLGA